MLPVEGKVRRKTNQWRCGHEIGEEAKASLQWRRYRLRRRSTTLLDAKAGRLPRGASRERAGLIGLWDKANDDGQAVGAVSSEAAEWYALEWPTIHRNVRRLQARIAQAAKEGRWGKVRALQRLLTHSYSGKVLAVRRVTENTGKKTPGVDREIWDTPEKQGSLPTSFCIQTASHSKGRSRCLSRMTGNCHVRLLEGRTPVAT